MTFIREYRYSRFLIASVVASFAAFETVRLGWGEIQETYVLRLILAGVLNICILVTAVVGERENHQRRNAVMILVLLLYAIADMFALNSSWFQSMWKILLVGACYLAGHILLLILLNKTGEINRIQYLVFAMVFTVSALVLLAERVRLPNWPIFLIYAGILSAVFAFSLKNTYYRSGCIIFLLGDLIGLGHMTLTEMNNPLVHILSLGIYYLGLMCFASSTYKK